MADEGVVEVRQQGERVSTSEAWRGPIWIVLREESRGAVVGAPCWAEYRRLHIPASSQLFHPFSAPTFLPMANVCTSDTSLALGESRLAVELAVRKSTKDCKEKIEATPVENAYARRCAKRQPTNQRRVAGACRFD